MDDLLAVVERMAGGDSSASAPLSGLGDEMDAVSHGVNVLAGELNYRLKQLQETQGDLVQSAKLATLGEVSSGLAHELNNPLAIIRGYVEMAIDEVATLAAEDRPVLESLLRRMDANIDRMDAIIRHIMEFSRQSPRKRQPVRVSDLVSKSFILLNEQLRLKNIRVERDLDESLHVLGDDLRLEQVLINLLTNARDAVVEAHSGANGGAIRVAARLAGQEHVIVSVEDNGIGMTEEVKSKIFNPFFSTKEVGKGTGLGLSISLGIVEEQGGEITCESELGRGARFCLRLQRWNPEAGGRS